MFHKLTDGDDVQIIPFFTKSKEIIPIFTIQEIYLGGKFICDNDKKILRRFQKYAFTYTQMDRLSIVTRYIFAIWHENQIKFIRVGKTLYELISKSSETYPKLKIVINKVDIGSQVFDNYDFCYLMKSDIQFTDQTLYEFLDNNQVFYLETYVDRVSISRAENMKIFLDSYSEEYNNFLALEREQIIDKLLTDV